MRTPRLFPALVALALPALVLAAPPAHADQSYSGTFTASDPTGTIYEPQAAGEAQGCPLPGAADATTLIETTSYIAQTTGNRSVTVKVDPSAVGEIAMYLYRNGACVGADYQADNPAEEAAGVIDIVDVPFVRGDTVKIVLGSFTDGLAWSMTVAQPEPVPGAANGPAVGKARKLVQLPAARNCARGTAVLKVTRSAKVKARTIVVKAGGKKLKTIRTIKPGKVRVKHVPASATSIAVTAKLKSGKKVKVTRSYNHC